MDETLSNCFGFKQCNTHFITQKEAYTTVANSCNYDHIMEHFIFAYKNVRCKFNECYKIFNTSCHIHFKNKSL